MTELIIWIFCLTMLGIALFLGAVTVIKIYKHCSDKEAYRIIFRFLSGKEQYHLRSDNIFSSEVWDNLSKLFDDTHYQALIKLNNTCINPSLLYFDTENGVSCFYLSLLDITASERIRVETVIKNLIRNRLSLNGIKNDLYLTWFIREDLNIPVLKVYFAENEAEQRNLDKILLLQQKKIVQRFNPIMDDEEEENLNDE